MACSDAPTRTVSVLHVLAPGDVGGKEAVVSALLLGTRGSTVEARVAAVVPSGRLGCPFITPFRNAGVEAFTIEVPRRGYVQERAEVARLCRRLRPDVVHTHGYRADVLDAAIARGLGIPVVSTVHGFTGGDRRNRFYQWLQRRALRRFDAVVAVSRTLMNDLAEGGVPRERLHYVQNAWHPPEPALDRERSEEHTSELQSRLHLVCRLLLEKKKSIQHTTATPTHNSALAKYPASPVSPSG